MEIKIGDHLTHIIFGPGEVIRIHSSNSVTMKFDDGREGVVRFDRLRPEKD